MLFEGTYHMRTYGLALLAIIFLIPTVSYADGTLNCGIKPIPKAGCRIGRCVDGMWEQICDTSPTISCGKRPGIFQENRKIIRPCDRRGQASPRQRVLRKSHETYFGLGQADNLYRRN